jgi:hypothetical protein
MAIALWAGRERDMVDESTDGLGRLVAFLLTL